MINSTSNNTVQFVVLQSDWKKKKQVIAKSRGGGALPPVPIPPLNPPQKKVQHYLGVWYLIKSSIINLKEFTVDSINDFGWESNISIRLLSTQFQWIQTSERLNWKTTYSMILANNKMSF